MAASTYGVATLLAAAYHDEDKEAFDTIFHAVERGTIVASTFQLVYTLLHTMPRGRMFSGVSKFDIRDEAFDHFANRLSEGTAKASAFSGSDPLDFVTAVTTVVMGSIQPLLEGDEPPAVNVEQEGIDPRAFAVVMACISEAAVDSFRAYIGITDIMPDLGDSPTYKQSSERLLSLVPKIAYRLEKDGGDNI